ncbi:MAG: histidine kinase dimerization/phosphoacceptor domain -containing protein [Pseudomonadota bacterium]
MTVELKLVDLDAARNADAVFPQAAVSLPFTYSVLNSSPDCIKIIERDGAVSFMNYNGQCAMEIDDFGAIAGKQWCDLWPEAAQEAIQEAVEKALEGQSSRFEALCPTGKGRAKWWDVSVSPIREESGEIFSILSISRDISHQIEREKRLQNHDQQLKALNGQLADMLEEKEALIARQDTLLREIDHRVKNSLGMIVALLRMQLNATDNEDVEKELHDAANRVSSIARVHERLYHSGDISRVALVDYLQPLCVEVHQSMAPETVRLSMDVDAVTMSSDGAVTVGLMVSELLANAIRHAYDEDGEGGEIRVMVKKVGDSTLDLCVEDDGKGLPADFDMTTTRGLGMKIVRLYAQKLGSEWKATNNAHKGASFRLVFSI